MKPGLAAAAVVMALIVVACSEVPKASCDPLNTVDLITGASASDVFGVVEYEVIAENGASFGKSVAASRRIWGDAVVDRWVVTASRAECPTSPSAEIGDRWYRLVGPTVDSDRLVYGAPSGQIISDLEAGALASIVGEPVQVSIGTIDRTMAWMRVNWWIVIAGMIPLVAVGAVVARRRSGARRDYLF